MYGPEQIPQPQTHYQTNAQSVLSYEWLETDGFGAYACGTVGWGRTRRQHALLAIEQEREKDYRSLLASVDVWVELDGEIYALSSQNYKGGLVWPNISSRIRRFRIDPWPVWTFDCSGIQLELEVFMCYGKSLVCISVNFATNTNCTASVIYRPYITMRGVHTLSKASAVNFPEKKNQGFFWEWNAHNHPQGLVLACKGILEAHSQWCGPFFYNHDKEIKHDSEEILYCPGVFKCQMAAEPVPLLATSTSHSEKSFSSSRSPEEIFSELKFAEKLRRNLNKGTLSRAVECYVVKNNSIPTIVSRYPSLREDTRDTLLAIRGFCLIPDFLRDCISILMQIGEKLRNTFLEKKTSSSSHSTVLSESVDIPLWFIISAWEVISNCQINRGWITNVEEAQLWAIATEVLKIYSQSFHPLAKVDDDGLLFCERATDSWGVCDLENNNSHYSKGKHLLIQILWLNAVWVISRKDRIFTYLYQEAQRSFEKKFWDEDCGFLRDSIDTGDKDRTQSPALRGEQVLAIGGLPNTVLRRDRAARLLDEIENQLLTPVGLRSLAPTHPSYTPRFEVDIFNRTSAFSSGAVWPWLIGPYIEAWVRVRGGGDDIKNEARQRFHSLVYRNFFEGGLGHLPEICEAEPPYSQRGCPFHVRGLAEIIRLREKVLKRSDEIPCEERPVLKIKTKGFEI